MSILNAVFFGCALRLVGILVPRPGIEPAPSAVKVQSPNRWIARDFPSNAVLSWLGGVDSSSQDGETVDPDSSSIH